MIIFCACVQIIKCSEPCKNELNCLKKKLNLLVDRVEKLESKELIHQAQLASQNDEIKKAYEKFSSQVTEHEIQSYKKLFRSNK